MISKLFPVITLHKSGLFLSNHVLNNFSSPFSAAAPINEQSQLVLSAMERTYEKDWSNPTYRSITSKSSSKQQVCITKSASLLRRCNQIHDS